MSTTTDAPRTDRSGAARRVLGLARSNAILLRRNRLTLTYALALPLLPMLLIFAGERGEIGPGAAAVSSVLMLTMLFPVYYNLLSAFVTRRDELVLKRLRTGETRDLELLTALALPGVVVAVLVSMVSIVIGLALGLPVPTNLLLYVVMVLVAAVMFVAFAYWTAAFTKNAEAAQITSMPVILLIVLGQVSIGFPDRIREYADLTPGAALTDLVRVSWFGLERDATEPTLGFVSSWAPAGQSLLVLAVWAALAIWSASRAIRWEPRV